MSNISNKGTAKYGFLLFLLYGIIVTGQTDELVREAAGVQIADKKSEKPNNAETFVVKKKKKKISKSKLQDILCTSFADQMNTIPDVHKKMAEVQKLLLDQTGKYIENSKECALITYNNQKLDELLQKAQKFQEALDQFCVACDSYIATLQEIC